MRVFMRLSEEPKDILQQQKSINIRVSEFSNIYCYKELSIKLEPHG